MVECAAVACRGVAESSQRQARGGRTVAVVAVDHVILPVAVVALAAVILCPASGLRARSVAAGICRRAARLFDGAPSSRLACGAGKQGLRMKQAMWQSQGRMLLRSAPLVLEFAQLTLPVPGAAREITAFSLLFAFWLFFELEPELSWRGAAACPPQTFIHHFA